VLLLSFMAAGKPITCPLCGSQKLIRLRDEEVSGTTTVVVQYLCDQCHAVFTRQPVKAASQENSPFSGFCGAAILNPTHARANKGEK
jgi:transposase-like protein